MAKYDITFSCGHNGTVELFGKDKDRQWRLERYRDFGICDECLKKSRDEENARMLEEAREMELPELLGTEKQIPWAITIRQHFIELLRNKQFYNDSVKEKTMDLFQNILETKIKANWWIDKRGDTLEEIINSEYERIQKEAKIKNIDNSTLAKQSKDEMTISAENVIHNGRVEVIVTDDLVKAIYEKNEDFRLIVKSLNFKWDGSCWSRKINQFTGLAEDRASELVAKLISKGFRIHCSNDNIRMKAVNGTYKAESNYWIINVDGNLGIRMYQKNESIYIQSRKITNSKWNGERKCVVVNISHYKEVLDFANTFGFSVTENARKNIEAEIEKENNNLKIAISDKENVQNNSYEILDGILKSEYNIIEDLRDD